MKLPVQIVESAPGQGIAHFIITPDYLFMEISSGSWLWEAHMTLLVNLTQTAAFRDFEYTIKNLMGRLPDLEVRCPISKPSSPEARQSYRILNFKECTDIKFELSNKDAPSKEEIFVDIDFKALLMNSEVKSFEDGKDYRVDKTMQTLSETNR